MCTTPGYRKEAAGFGQSSPIAGRTSAVRHAIRALEPHPRGRVGLGTTVTDGAAFVVRGVQMVPDRGCGGRACESARRGAWTALFGFVADGAGTSVTSFEIESCREGPLPRSPSVAAATNYDYDSLGLAGGTVLTEGKFHCIHRCEYKVTEG